MKTTVLYKLRDYKEAMVFEKEHPLELRWDFKYKFYMLTQNDKCQGVWLKLGKELVAESVLTWQSDNVVNIDSFTVLPAHRGKGLGYEMITTVLDWCKEMKFEHLIGEARKGASWHIFENLGASSVVLHKNWNGTGEDYMSFKLSV
jgi:GNAT superfamily N-acetyltransferase